MGLRIKNWEKFQHFKDRRPPWVKLYRELLDDIEWHQLDPVAAKTLVMLWLIASEDGGRLPDIKTISFRLRTNDKQVDAMISKLDHWIYRDDIDVSSPVKPPTNVSGHQETETETETERDIKSDIGPIVLPDWIPVEAWQGWLSSRKNKASLHAKKLAITELTKLRDAGHDPKAVLDNSALHGWPGLYPVKGAPARIEGVL